MKEILSPFINRSKALAPCGSSQANESWHNTIISKHPKSCIYGGSESHRVRVALSVLQKNWGYEYIIRINTALKLSPGKCTEVSRKKNNSIFYT